MADFDELQLPGFPVHPGISLREEIEARDMSVEELARLTERPLGEILAVVNERALIDRELAGVIGHALDTDVDGWFNMTTLYLLTLERDYRRDRQLDPAHGSAVAAD